MQSSNSSIYYFLACISFIVGLSVQDFFKIPLTGGIIILGLSWILTFRYKEKLNTLLSKPEALAFIAFYSLHLLSMFYTEHTSAGWRDVQLKISLFLLPLFMLSTHLFTQQKRYFLLQFFAITMVLMATIDLCCSFSDYLLTQDINVFFYKQLPHILKAKPHYVAWHYAFAMFVVLYQILRSDRRRLFWGIGFLLLLTSLILLSSRAYLMAFVIVFVVSFIKWAMVRKTSKVLWLKLVLFLSVLFTTLLLVPNTKSRIDDTIIEVQKFMGSNTHRETNPRVYLWSYASELIKEKPILGYGIGDAKTELNKALKNCDAKFWDGEKNVPIYEKNLNYHNQFLQTWAEVGVVGVFLLLFLMLRPFFLSKQHPLFLIFVGLTLIGFLTESMLERQAGVVLIAFMYPLLSGLSDKDC